MFALAQLPTASLANDLLLFGEVIPAGL
jgi:hypothetical protein